jgi:uncharacterized membrane protein (DUF4010 family)
MIRPGVIRRYCSQVGAYGAFVMAITWFLGYYNEVTAFFENNRTISVVAVVIHLILFAIGELAWSEKKLLSNLLVELDRAPHDER